jgi:hypothetical protein
LVPADSGAVSPGDGAVFFAFELRAEGDGALLVMMENGAFLDGA